MQNEITLWNGFEMNKGEEPDTVVWRSRTGLKWSWKEWKGGN